MADFFFKCPECGTEDDLVQYQDPIEIWAVNVVAGEIQHSLQQYSRSYENNYPYQCGDCGYELPAFTDDELLEWLKEHSVQHQESKSLE
jgi:predicted RNA-binding Zn-ribbon protein involved in translation (DUF1610 family)